MSEDAVAKEVPVAPPHPFEELTDKQRDILKSLESEIGADKIMVSFSIDNKLPDGQRRSAFVSATVAKQDGRASGWSLQESHIVSCMVSKMVVSATFRDAVTRQILLPQEAASLMPIMASYDKHIARLVQKLDKA